MAKRKRTAPPPRKPEKKTNPFEQVHNRQKHNVLNRRVKGGKKDVAESRAKSIKKRQESLLKELQSVDKSNSFDDRRLGEKLKGRQIDHTLTAEEKALKRFQVERQKRLSKSSKYNLNDDDDGGDGEDMLTHMGASLSSTLASMPSRRVADEFELGSDEEKEEFEAEAFATAMSEAGMSDPNRPKTKKEVMAEVIMKSKMHKAERAQERLEQLQLMDALDGGLSDIRDMLEFKTDEDKEAEKTAPSIVDEFMNEARKLGMESRARAADRLKTPEELAREERLKLEKLEAARLKRMNAVDGATLSDHETDENEGLSKRAARRKKEKEERKGESTATEAEPKKKKAIPTDDDLMDGYAVDPKFALADSGDESDGDHSRYAPKQAVSLSSDEEEDEDMSGDDSDSDEELDAVMKESLDDDIPFVFECPKTLKGLTKLFRGRQIHQERMIIERIIKCNHPSLADGNRLKMHKFFTILFDYFEQLSNEEHTPDTETRIDGVVLSIYEMSELLPKVAAYLTRGVLAEIRLGWQKRVLAASLAAKQRKENEGENSEDEDLSLSLMPTTYELLFLRLVAAIFPTSDFKHNVVTPALSTICELLVSVPMRGGRDVVAGLFLSALILQYVMDSKRYVPELVQYVRQLLSEGFGLVPKESEEEESVREAGNVAAEKEKIIHVRNPMPITFGSYRFPLFASYLQTGTGAIAAEEETSKKGKKTKGKKKGKKESKKESAPSEKFDSFLSLSLLQQPNGSKVFETKEFAGAAFSICLTLIDQLSKTYTFSSVYPEVFAEFASLFGTVLSEFPTLSPSISSRISSVKSELEKRSEQVISTRKPLVMIVKPKTIRQFTPMITENFTPGKDMDPNEARAELKQLKKKVKRETKGAMRELRKDTLFIEQEKRKNEAIAAEEREKERKRVKTILQSEATDSNIFAKMTKKKRKY